MAVGLVLVARGLGVAVFMVVLSASVICCSWTFGLYSFIGNLEVWRSCRLGGFHSFGFHSFCFQSFCFPSLLGLEVMYHMIVCTVLLIHYGPRDTFFRIARIGWHMSLLWLSIAASRSFHLLGQCDNGVGDTFLLFS